MPKRRVMQAAAFRFREDVRDPAKLAEVFLLKDGDLYRRTSVAGRPMDLLAVRPDAKINEADRNYTYFMARKLRTDQIAVAISQGKWPDEVDHLDGDLKNDEISNLVPIFGAKLPIGVQQRGSKYVSSARLYGVVAHIGTFDSPKAASEARRKYIAKWEAIDRDFERTCREGKAHAPEDFLGMTA